MDHKTVSPQERLYEALTRQWNPFLDPNFNVDQIANGEGDKINTLKIPKQAVDPNLAPSLNRLQFQGFKFLEDNLEDLQVTIEALKDRFDVPFDELYHKEKRLVDAVIKAT